MSVRNTLNIAIRKLRQGCNVSNLFSRKFPLLLYRNTSAAANYHHWKSDSVAVWTDTPYARVCSCTVCIRPLWDQWCTMNILPLSAGSLKNSKTFVWISYFGASCSHQRVIFSRLRFSNSFVTLSAAIYVPNENSNMFSHSSCIYKY